jgi:hypothetical protein
MRSVSFVALFISGFRFFVLEESGGRGGNGTKTPDKVIVGANGRNRRFEETGEIA